MASNKKRSPITADRVFGALESHGPMSAAEIALALGHGRSGVPAVTAALTALDQEDLIQWQS
jgi:hypothetical protein